MIRLSMKQMLLLISSSAEFGGVRPNAMAQLGRTFGGRQQSGYAAGPEEETQGAPSTATLSSGFKVGGEVAIRFPTTWHRI